MVELAATGRPVRARQIGPVRHLRNIFASGELEREAVVAKNATTAADGKTYQVDFYNLDAIISVGYRVNSTRATRFRQWATRVLSEHLTQGYSLNEHRLAQQGMAELEQAMTLLSQTLERQELVTDIGREAVGIIMRYARTGVCCSTTMKAMCRHRRANVIHAKVCP